MNDSQLMFDERLRRLGKTQWALSGGYTSHMRKDGLLIRRPKPSKPGVPGRQALVAVLVFLSVKVFLMASLGDQDYSVRLAELQQGTIVDRLGAVLMQPDPLSKSLARAIDSGPG